MMMKRFTLSIAGGLIACCCAMAHEDTASFEKFWPRFRTAVLRSDWPELKRMTGFPLHVRGSLDVSPERSVSGGQFRAAFQKFLRQGVFHGSEELKLIREAKSAAGAVVERRWARIGNMEFVREVDDDWQLKRIYMLEE
jgi:hypothetical protein